MAKSGVAKKDLPEPQVIEERFTEVFNAATEQDILIGMGWYAKARMYAESLAAGSPYTLEQCMGILAVVSPGTDWAGKNDSVPAQIINVHASGKHLCKVGPEGPDSTWPFRSYDCIKKAQRILDGDLTAIKGNKVTAFYRNISGNYDPPTIDGWMVKIALAEPKKKWGELGINSDGPGAYKVLADALRASAGRVGMTNGQFQAVCWESYRRKHTVRKGA
jgi:hypothetical protein